jgi:hypothetical protein
MCHPGPFDPGRTRSIVDDRTPASLTNVIGNVARERPPRMQLRLTFVNAA